MLTKIKLFLERTSLSSFRLKLFLGFSFLPLLIGFTFLFFKLEVLKRQEEKVKLVAEQINKTKNLRNLKARYLSQYEKIDSFFIKNKLEPLNFLEREGELVQHLLKQDAFCLSSFLQNRLSFLQGSENKLIFSQEEENKDQQLQETIEGQIHPIELNASDLQKLLCCIEKTSLEKTSLTTPLMFIQNIELKKAQNEALLLDHLTLIKREFLFLKGKNS